MILIGRKKTLTNYHILISHSIWHLFISQSFYYPEHVGLKIGTNDTSRYIVMETHYDNPDHKDGMYNSMCPRNYLGSEDVSELHFDGHAHILLSKNLSQAFFSNRLRPCWIGFSDFVDSSGLRLWYTNETRMYDASTLYAGWDVTYQMVIPPKQSKWETVGYCPGACIEKVHGKEANVYTGLDTSYCSDHEAMKTRRWWRILAIYMYGVSNCKFIIMWSS